MKRNRRISLSDNTLELIKKAYPDARNTVALEEFVRHYFRLQNQNELYGKALDDEGTRRKKLQDKCDKRDRAIAWIIVVIVATMLTGMLAVLA